MIHEKVSVIGAGLAGCECALTLADRGVAVQLYEMRPRRSSPAHHTDRLAELVCSNSFKATRRDSAAGLLKEEIRRLGSHLLKCAEQASIPAGGALAVDRQRFSELVEAEIASHRAIEVVRREVCSIPAGPVVIAAGPLCSPALAEAVRDLVGAESLSFFDAAAPIVDASTLDMDVLFEQSRYERAGGDYLNAPLDRRSYEAFITELIGADRVNLRDFERKELFQACQPAEEVARSGRDAIRFGAMKPVGLIDPRTGARPWAVLQLRAENAARSAYNLVGFQTNLTFPEQKRVFRMVPGLGHAEFFRMGVMHRNTFVDAPHVLDSSFAVPETQVRLAGQITGTEGYTEAIASGLLAGLNTFCDLAGAQRVHLPVSGALASLVGYATDPATVRYQPMHVNFGLVPPLPAGVRLGKRDRYRAYARRALESLDAFIAERIDVFAGPR
ncbi:gid protein [Coriobacterium glomerans PW2]|uniref:Methylenetetrahydrofolate--tRNA-(uracil-5-)-methyltransferase TrmFO n=1 Tax=Coriobacterium glomerans (strain ATCC 49209 / DSM 20642 / JCM 10262 / PW2) TaxID=700015 RepID=F2N9G6_CORGP|nr:methylenetetrahydrofolate--tRNA-(uracil(54)-C(5))-methyltransferase (FADH(2)-oxidizing) TrmFO [Coriobacterium glomerans]AEB06995.1 gid protein [Coriobacterium glomerans PW2]